jgi:hypothetical protein
MILKDDMAKWIPEMENKKETVSSFFLRQPMFQEKFREQNDPFEKIQRMRKLRRG